MLDCGARTGAQFFRPGSKAFRRPLTVFPEAFQTATPDNQPAGRDCWLSFKQVNFLRGHYNPNFVLASITVCNQCLRRHSLPIRVFVHIHVIVYRNVSDQHMMTTDGVKGVKDLL
jgi:hypothetical protein